MIVIVFIIGLNLLGYQSNTIVQLARHSLEYFFGFKNISFDYFFLSNCKSLACLIDKII